MFTPIEWQDEYSVDVKELDDQHKILLRIINKLLKEQKDELYPTKLLEAISSLIHYAYVHFATEEQYLTQAHFPDIERHILEHINFIMKTLELMLKVKDGSQDNRLELLRYLKGWYSSHVLGIDRLYIPFLKSKLNNS